MRIGNVEIPNNIFLAPMAGVTDLAFRLLCKEQGAGMVYTEMVSAKGLYYGSEKTKELLKVYPGEHPVGVQIFGSEPDIMADIARWLSESEVDVIDINMGCPAPKIVKNGEGSALMKEPERVRAIVKAVVAASQKPVTVKIRKGWDDSHVNAVEIARIAEGEGAMAVTVHGRTREQYYSGEADWTIIGEVKRHLSIPVIGNGDLFTPQAALQMLKETGCDGIMVARGAQGNPWIFRDILHYLKTGEILPPPTPREKVEMALRHMDLVIQLKGEKVGIPEMRKHIGWYIKGLRGATRTKNLVNQASSREEIYGLLNALIDELEEK